MSSLVRQSFLWVTSIAVIAASTIIPSQSNAKLSKTYTINTAAAKNYTTQGVTLATAPGQSSWYSPNWKYRQKITINKDFIGEELTDFPVVIRLDDQSLTDARDDRHDLVFTASDGSTPLAYERDDNNTAWVKVPVLNTAEDTTLYLYYGNPNVAGDQAKPQEVWTNHYGGVWHFDDDPVGVAQDATGHANNGRFENYHSASYTVDSNDNSGAGLFNRALRFYVGSDNNSRADYLNVGTSEAIKPSHAITYEAWVKPNAVMENYDSSGYGHIVSAGNNWNENVIWLYGAEGKAVGCVTTSTGTICANSTTSVSGNVWHHFAMTFDSGALHLYQDGERVASASCACTLAPRSAAVTWGGPTANAYPRFWANYYLQGLLDEGRIATDAKSAAWIAAEHANQSGDDTFLTISSVETTPTVATTSTPSITLKKDRALSFSSLSSFSISGSGTPTFQLSPDKGTTWYYYTKQGWAKTTTKSSRVLDVTAHLKTFPKGTGQLLWKAFVPTNSTLNSITIQYEPGTTKATSKSPTSLDDPRIQNINTLFQQVYGRVPTYDEWLYWTNRVINQEKATQEALLGAMQWRKATGQ